VAVHAVRDDGGRRLIVEPVQDQLVDRAGVEAVRSVVAGGEQHHDALGVEPARDEQQRLRGGRIEPLSVVDHAEDGTPLGELGQQREARDRDEEAVLPGALREPQRTLERGCLRSRQRVEQVHCGPQQLVQARPRELRFRLNPPGPEDVHVGGSRPGIIQQRSLPDAGRAAHDQRAAA
jgi:hypothetical protein